MKYAYPAIFAKEDDGIIVRFPDVPGAFTDGGTMEEAWENAEDVLNLMLMGMEDDKDDIKPPTKLSDIHIQAEESVMMVRADTGTYRKKVDTRSVRKNISIPGWMDTALKAQNINLSNFVQNALQRELGIN